MFISEDKYIKKFSFYSKLVDLGTIKKNRKKVLEIRKSDKIKLRIELVPTSTWFNNVRSKVKDSEWNRIRYITYGLADYKCEICLERGTRHPVECHEIWDFNNSSKIQTLKGFIALCPLCHETKHIGLAGIRGNYDRAYKRFLIINGFSEKEGKKHFDKFIQEWKERSKLEWEIDFKVLNHYNINVSE